LLAEAPLTVGEISEVLLLPQPTVSRHLKNLRATGLLFDHRDGNRTIIRLVEPAGNGPADLPDLLNQWIRRQPLPRALRTRLDHVLSKRDGEQDSFARLAHQWDEIRCRYFGSQFALEALASLLPPGWRALDVGTGTGYLLPTLARNFREVVAVDPSGAMLKLSQEISIREGLRNIRFRYGRLESLPLAPESVDLALAILVLHHSERLADALSELHRVLIRKGTVLIVDIMPHEMEDFQREMGDPVRGLEPETTLALAKHWNPLRNFLDARALDLLTEGRKRVTLEP